MNTNIEKTILSKSVIRGNAHYYKYENAIELVDICQQNNLPILGIDSFVVTETKTQPFMEHSIDYSNIPKGENSFELAKVFLKSKKSYGFVFEIVY